MRRRILTAIIGVDLLTVLILSVPFGVVVSNRETDAADRELDRVAKRVEASLDPSQLDDGVGIDLRESDQEIHIAVYDRTGRRVAGAGPDTADEITRRPGVNTMTTVVGARRVLVLPVVSDEQRIGTVRVSELSAEVMRAVRRDLSVLALIDVAALLTAIIVGFWVSGRLNRPIRDLRDDASRVGPGDREVSPRRGVIAQLREARIDVLPHHLPPGRRRAGRDVEPEPVGRKTEDAHIGDHLALRRERRGVQPLSGLERNDVVGDDAGERLAHLRALGDAAAVLAAIEQERAVP